ncbi:MAG: 60S ribosomal protein L31 [Candidatus Diapherotrites archaeon]|nr:60S ribosomal protein L31 [Candidatus Diapherotrites archaeon]
MEKLINFSFRKLYRQPRTKRAKRAINHLRRTLAKRFHVSEENVWISPKINELIWEKGFSKVPRVMPLKIIQEETRIKVLLQGEELTKPKEKEAKKKKEEKKQAEEHAKEEKEKPKEEKKEKQKEEEQKKKLQEKKEIERAAEKAAIKRKLDK